MEHNSLIKYLLMLGDNSMIIGHRLSELCGHAPTLETDIALTNISLDFFGEVRSYFQYAAQLKGDGCSEDTLAYLRFERDYLNCILVEQPNTDFAHVIVRQFLFDQFHNLLLQDLQLSTNETIKAIANKSIKESNYHLRFSNQWLLRLGGGTEISNSKMQNALDNLFPFVFELFVENEIDKEMKAANIGADLTKIESVYFEKIKSSIKEAQLIIKDDKPRYAQGKNGIHTEHLGYILNEFQYMQRAYPNMQW